MEYKTVKQSRHGSIFTVVNNQDCLTAI